MADQRQHSSRPKNLNGKNSPRTNGTGSVGRARARQNQRERASELRRSVTQAVSPGGLRSTLESTRLQAPSLKDVQNKLADLNPGELIKRRPSRRQARPVASVTQAASESSQISGQRRTARRVAPIQQVVGMPQHKPAGAHSRLLLSENRSHREYRATSANQAKMPPVLVRGGLSGMAVPRPKQRLPKRRYDVALNVPGAELRLPSLPMVRVGWRIVSGMLAVMMLACLFMMWKLPAFQVNTVEAEGLQRLTVGDLNTVMDILGSSIFTIDPPAVEQALSQAFPELASISVNAGLPARVVVNLVERQPVLSWFQDNREVWVDAEGVAFVPRGNPGTLVRVEGHGIAPQAIASVVIPTAGSLPPGAIFVPATDTDEASAEAERVAVQPARLPRDLVKAILPLGSQVPADTQLVYDAQYGLGWDDPLGWEVYFGAQTDEMDQKLVVYQGVVEYLTDQGLQPELVSVAFVHAPYYRMER